MSPVPLVRAAVLGPVVTVLAGVGAPVSRLLERAGLPARILEHPETLIPLRQGVRFLGQSARAEGITNLGFLSGQVALTEGPGLFGRLVQRAATLAEALRLLTGTAAAFNSGERWWLAAEGQVARLCHMFTPPLDVGREQADHYALALAIALVRLAAGTDWTPAAVALESRRVAGLAERTPLLANATIRFEQPATSVAFPARFLDLPVSSPAEAGHDDDVSAWLASAPARDFPGSVHQVAQALSLSGAHANMAGTARALGISVRTLQRRLAEHGERYDRLVRNGRLTLATHLLERTDARVVDIALDLGYSDHAHFTRAFRRWTGLAPLAYRRSRGPRPQDDVERRSNERDATGLAVPDGVARARLTAPPATSRAGSR